MGGVSSALSERELAQYESTTFFTKKELKMLYNRFEALGGSSNLPINGDVLISIPELRNNPFRFRICEVFGKHMSAEAARAMGVTGGTVRRRKRTILKKDPDLEMGSVKKPKAKGKVGQNRARIQAAIAENEGDEGDEDGEDDEDNDDDDDKDEEDEGDEAAGREEEEEGDEEECESEEDLGVWVDVEEYQSEHYLKFHDFVHLMNAFSPRASIQLKAHYAFKMYDFDGDRFINTNDIVRVLETSVGMQRMTHEKMHEIAKGVLDEADLDGSKKLSVTEFNRIIKRIPDFMSKFQFSVQLDIK